MFRYVLVLLLINAYSRSLGGPVQNASKISLPNFLTDLASRCENQVLSTLIKSKIGECNVSVPLYTPKQFECLMFIDINSQLCDAVTTSKLAVSEELTAKINESVEVDKLCSITSKWNITNLKEFPLYKATAKKVFNNTIACAKVCNVDDVMSQDTNFYCKYYKWGSEILNNQVSTTATQVTRMSVISGSAEKDDDIKVLPDASNPVNSAVSSNNNIQTSKDTPNLPLAKPTFVKVNTLTRSESTSLGSSTKNPPVVLENVEGLENTASNTEGKISKPEDQAAVAQDNSGHSNEGIEKPSPAEEQLPNTEDAGKIEKPLNDHANENAEKPQQQSDPDDYDNQDGQEGREGLPDTQGAENSYDPYLDAKLNMEQSKDGAKKNSITSIKGDREYMANPMQEGFADDDDHFFPFFLTAVILVVLLYVLYHNKNKVSKVFLGLIVEGRQPGRRRNSRGHAYRRLDTLEQAMSTNTAAPPSKIIY